MRRSWRQFVLYFTIAGMELSWLYVWLALFTARITEGAVSPFGVLSLYGLSFGFNKFISRWKIPRRYSLALNSLLWLAGLLVIIKFQLYSALSLFDRRFLLALPRVFAQFGSFGAELQVFFSSIILWVLGFRLAKTRTGFTIAVTEFQVGLALLLIAFLVSSQMKAEIGSSILVSLAFISFALLGMAIAHGEQGNSWLTSRGHGYWMTLLLVVIIFVIVLGLFIGSFITPDILELMTLPFKLLWGLVDRVMTFIAHFGFWDKLFGQPVKELIGSDKPAPPEIPEEGFGIFELSSSARNNLRFIMNVMWISIIFLALWRMFSVIFSWLRRRVEASSGVEMESLNGAFKEDFFAFLKKILSWFAKRLRLLFLRRGLLRSAIPEAATVREIYRQLLSWAASKGWPRAYSQTPYEYLYTLNEALPLFQGELSFITSQYVRVRYGSFRPDGSELTQLKKGWQKVRQGEEKLNRR